MSPTPSKLPPGASAWHLTALAALTLLVVPGCAPADDAGDDAMTDDTAMADGMAMEPADAPTMAQDAPACQFTASGEELTGRASPPDSTSAQVGGATAKICYGAPSMRDRVIFGGLEEFGEPWRIGANEPTTLHLPVAATIGTVQVDPGSYSLFAIPGESEWEIVVNSNVDRWGIPIDAAVRESDVGSFTVQSESIDPPVEQLSIEMTSTNGGAEVVIEWETTRVTFPIEPAQ